MVQQHTYLNESEEGGERRGEDEAAASGGAITFQIMV